MKNCGISRWDDPREINAKLKALTDQPIWEVSDDYYNNVVLPYYDEKCKGLQQALPDVHVQSGRRVSLR